MTAIAKWVAGTAWTDALTTELNSLATGTVRIASSAITNATNLDIYADFSAILASVDLSAKTNPRFDVYLIRLLSDGTTYEDGTDNTTTAGLLPVSGYVGACVFQIGTGAAAHGAMLQGILIPPGSFKPAIIQNSGATLGASGNKFSYRTYNLNLNA